jgi:hypothetical protein
MHACNGGGNGPVMGANNTRRSRADRFPGPVCRLIAFWLS